MSLPSPSQPLPSRFIESMEPAENMVNADQPLLSSADIRADPILAALAKKQRDPTAAPPSNHTFKARPAPTGMRDNVGPRMTKSAALRQGLPWEEIPRARPSVVGTNGARPSGALPGHKRASLSTNIKSLAAPAVVPRQTKASQLRTGEAVTTVPSIRRDAATALADNKARAAEEKLRRRASIAVPASLSAPQIAPRGNRSSELRGGTKGTAVGTVSSFRAQPALSPTTSTNVGSLPTPTEKKDEKLSKRASVVGMVRSLKEPSIQPRLNKTTMLRAPAAPASTGPASAAASISTATTAILPRPKLAPYTSSLSLATKPAQVPDGKTALGPRPTKSSLLRAGLGAKVQTR